MLVNCKSCGKEIGKGVKKCVHCGADQRNWFSKHKVLTGILAIVIVGITSVMSSPSTTPIQTKDGKTISAKTLTFPDGRKYVGELKDGEGSGYGILYKADGSISYEGEFIDGQPAILSTTTAPVPVTNPTPSPAPVVAPTNKPTMTMAEFTQLKDGMSYEEATKIIGGPGEVMSESGSKGDAAHTVMYTYKGEGSLGANANVMFQGEKLMNKAQFGLK